MNRLIVIVAADERGGIGKEGRIPWHLKGDMQRFKMYTMGNVVVMGRKTYDSIGHALKGRVNVVITRDVKARLDGIDLISPTPDNIPSLKEIFPGKDIYVIGGAEIYKSVWQEADLIYYTRVHATLDCDRFVPMIPMDCMLIRSVETSADNDNDYSTTFEIWKKKKPSKAERLLR